MSPTWAWLALLGNFSWVYYGALTSEWKLLIPGAVWMMVMVYVLARVHLEGRDQARAMWYSICVGCGIIALGSALPNSVGFVAGALITAGAAPQAWRVWRSKDVAGIAPKAWGFTLTLSVLWTVYAINAGLTEVWVTNVALAITVSVILAGWFKVKHAQARAV